MVGERWALLVSARSALGSHRFTEIVRGTGAPRDRIAARLHDLEEAGVIERRRLPGPTRCEYHLTDSGRELVPVLDALSPGAASTPSPPTTPTGAPLRAPWRLDEETPMTSLTDTRAGGAPESRP